MPRVSFSSVSGSLSFDDDFHFLIEELPSKDETLIQRDFLQPMKSFTDHWTVDELIGPSRGGSAGPR